MTTARKKTVKPSNTTCMWRIYIFVVNELEKEVRDRGFQSIPNLVNFILAAYFKDQIIRRMDVNIDDIDLSSLATTPTSWRIRTPYHIRLRQDAKTMDSNMSALANHILVRYVLGQRIKRGE